MASASSKKSLDTDFITFRRVFAKLSDNSQVPANYVLASYGDGRTYWAQPSTLGLLPTFNEVYVDSNQYLGSLSSGILRFSGSNGLVLSTLTSATSSLQVYTTDYVYIDVSGATSLYGYSNFEVNNTLRIETTGFLSSGTAASQNLVTIGSLREAPALSTNIVSYQTIKVISSLQSNVDTTAARGVLLSKSDPSTFLTWVGIQDFQFQTNFTPTVVTLSLSSYTARDFLGLSSLLGTSYLSTISSISSLYTQKDIFSTALISLSTTEYRLYSTNVSTLIELSNYTQLRYDQRFGETMARATIIQLNDQFGVLNTGMSTISSVKAPVYVMQSTTKGLIDTYSSVTTLSTSTFANFQAGSIFNFRINGLYIVSTQLSTLSTNVGTSIRNYQTVINTSLQQYIVSTNSTVAHLGTIGYISSLTLQSSIKEIGTAGYISTPSLVSTVSTAQTIYNLQTNFVSSLQSTTAGLFARQEIISTLTLASSLTSTTRGLQLETALTYVSTLGLTTIIRSTTSGTVGYMGANGYISTPTLISSYISSFAFGISSVYTLRETLLSTLRSTTTNVSTSNSLVFISVPSLVGYASTLSNDQYIERNQLQSTVTGLLTGQSGLFQSTLVIPEYFFSDPPVPPSPFVVAGGPREISMTIAFQGPFYSYSAVGLNQYFSSVQFNRLGGYGSLFKGGNFVTIEYTPSIFFSEYTAAYSNYASNYLSTLVQIGETFYSSSLFVERTYLTSLGSNGDKGSNIYSRKMMFQMTKDDFLNAEDNGFAITHLFQNIVVGTEYAVSTQISLYTPRSNALFISIYN